MGAVASRSVGRGRQPAAIETERDLLAELVAERHENRVFAERVAAAAARIPVNLVAGRTRVVEQTASELGYYADRRLRQLGSAVL